MADKKPKYIEGIGWCYDTEHSMHRRMTEHDYRTCSIYMITMSVEGRRPLLGELKWKATDGCDAHIETTLLGAEVERCWMSINDYYPEAEPLRAQVMPDHIHGLLFVKRDTTAHLGQIINGFKVGCNRAYRQLAQRHEAVECYEALSQESRQETGHDPQRPKHSKHGMLFETGYHDSVLKGKGQLEHMF